jgi:hypothetical protein
MDFQLIDTKYIADVTKQSFFSRKNSIPIEVQGGYELFKNGLNEEHSK